jgi:hypothetical protein
MLARAWKLDNSYTRVFAILLLSSPIYLFWGTAFLIETFAVFCGFWFLARVDLATRSFSWTTVALSVFCGVLAALGKITTFVPFACIAGVILLREFMGRLRRHEPLPRPILGIAAIMGLPLALFSIWNRFTDAQKLKNPIAIHMMSSLTTTHQWFFGTWAQLFSIDMLLTLLRALTDTLGVLAVPILIASAWLAISLKIIDRRAAIVVSGSLGAFILPFILFTNVHIIHNYYDAENAIFMICAFAALLTRLFSSGHRQAGWNLLVLTIASQVAWLGMFFVHDIRHLRDRPLLAIAQAVDAKTDPDSVIVIYGQDYSSVIPYYSRRRAVMEPDSVSIPNEEVLDRAHHMLAPQGGYPVEAVVRCKSQLDQVPEFNRIFADFDTHISKQRIAGCDVYFVGSSAVH